MSGRGYDKKDYIDAGIMDILQDDATILSALEDNSIGGACVDKGLLDALFCAECYDQMEHVMQSVHRVLQPGTQFVVFSFSKPEYILNHMLSHSSHQNQTQHDRRKYMQMWSHVEVRALDSILMYRYEKRMDPKQRRRRRK